MQRNGCKGCSTSMLSIFISHISHLFWEFFFDFLRFGFSFLGFWDGRVKCRDCWHFDANFGPFCVDSFELRPLLRLPDKSSPFANFDTFGWRWRPSAISRSSHPRAVLLAGFLELTAFTRIELLGPWEFEWYN